MKMKFIKNIFATAAVVLAAGAFTACDYLDIEPENTVPSEDVDYTNISDMYQPVSGCYAKIRTGNMHWIINLLTNMRDGDIWSGRVDDQGDLVAMDKYVYNPSWWGTNEMWKQYYGMVKVCNRALESLDAYAANIKNDADMKKYRSYCGEVRTIRALAYFRLTQMFGDVTIMTYNEQSNLRPSKKEVVWEYILQDLQYAMDNTPLVRPNEMEHIGAFSGYSAMALAAKVNLYKKDYAKVAELTNAIIESRKFELYNDFYELFKIPGRLCNESLMECQVSDFGVGDGEYVGVDQFFACTGPSLSNATLGLNVGGWTFQGYYDTFLQWAAARGETVRDETSFLRGGTTTRDGDAVGMPGNPLNTSVWNGKHYLPINQLTPGRTGYGQNNNVRIMRYADVLLMNAEAKVRQSQNGDAPFNLVRGRANMPELSGVTVQQILDERRMEFCGEWGEHYCDLVRTGEAASVLGSRGWSEALAYYPIPTEQETLAVTLKYEPFTSLEEALAQK